MLFVTVDNKLETLVLIKIVANCCCVGILLGKNNTNGVSFVRVSYFMREGLDDALRTGLNVNGIKGFI